MLMILTSVAGVTAGEPGSWPGTPVAASLEGLGTVPGQAQGGGEGGTNAAVSSPDGALARFIARNDLNGDGADDRLESMVAGGALTAHVFIDYSRDVTPEDVARLGALDIPVFSVARSIDAVTVDAFPLALLDTVAGLDGVALIEYAPPLAPFLSNSVPSMRVAPSSTYSPNTVWDQGYSGAGVALAIMDTGVDDALHNSLRGSFVAGADFSGALMVNNTNPDDAHGHGTHCAGIALGRGVMGDQGRGVAPNASLIDLKIASALGDSWGTKLVTALQWCIDNGPTYGLRVVSISYGTQSSSDGNDAVSRQVNSATAAGLAVVVAMGNDGSNTVPTPAAADTAISVGATYESNTVPRGDDYLAYYSNRGPRPSDGDGDTLDELKPDVCAPGSDISAPKHNTINTYITFSGTSMATPGVAGMVALMLEADPTLTPAEVKTLLRTTSQGAGSVSYPEKDPKYNTGYGWGMVDGYGGVKRILDHATAGMTGPSHVNPSDTGIFTGRASLTRTEFNTGTDSLRFTFDGSDDWSTPTNIQVSGGSVAYSSSTGAPRDAGKGRWEQDVWVNYTGQPSSTTELHPQVTYYSTAPAEGTTKAVFGVRLDYNGIAGDSAKLVVNQNGSEEDVDLYVTNDGIIFSNDQPEPDETILITALINNSGTDGVTGAEVRFTDGPPQTGILIADVEVDVPGGGSTPAYAAYTATPGVHTIYVEIDRNDNITETDEDNNTAWSILTVVSSGGGGGGGGGGLPGLVNIPPQADLSVSPGQPVVGQEVTFDASGSSDVDGQVVLYQFEFGDGAGTDWVTDSIVKYTYTTSGNFQAQVVVEDNGQEQSNAAVQRVNVSYGGGGTMDLYMDGDMGLSLVPPDKDKPKNATIESGLGPFIISSREVGTWESPEGTFTRTFLTMDSAVFTGHVANMGDQNATSLTLEFTLNLNGEELVSERATANGINAGESAVLVAQGDLPSREVHPGDVLAVEVVAQTATSGLEFLYWGENQPSGVEIGYTYPIMFPPTASAGEDFAAYTGQNATFQGAGNDSDGSVVLYEWDFESDGLVDWNSTATGVAFHIYEKPGDHVATLTVYDDDQLTDSDTVNISVTDEPVNAPPTVDIDEPGDNDTVSGELLVEGDASDDVNVTKVEVRFGDGGWKTARGTEEWNITWDTTTVENDLYTIEARSYGGSQYSEVAIIEVNVENINEPPKLTGLDLDMEEVPNDGETEVVLIAEVEDPDGLEDIVSVTADMSDLGMDEDVAMGDDGEDGDDEAGDGVYTLVFTVGAEVEPGRMKLVVTVTDTEGQDDDDRVNLKVVKFNYLPEIGWMTFDPSAEAPDGESEVLLVVPVTNGNGPDDIESVTADLSEVGGARRATLRDDGSKGDATAGDGEYSLLFVISEDTEEGSKTIEVTVTDVSGAEVTESTFFLVMDIEGFIDDINALGDGAEEDASQFMMFMVIGIIMIVVLVVIAAAAASSSKKKERQVEDPYGLPPPPPPGDGEAGSKGMAGDV